MLSIYLVLINFSHFLQIFTTIFTVEMIVKLVALGPMYYIQGRWNIFDGIIVIISLVDTGLELAEFRESSGTSVFRTFRLVRTYNFFPNFMKFKD